MNADAKAKNSILHSRSSVTVGLYYGWPTNRCLLQRTAIPFATANLVTTTGDITREMTDHEHGLLRNSKPHRFSLGHRNYAEAFANDKDMTMLR